MNLLLCCTDSSLFDLLESSIQKFWGQQASVSSLLNLQDLENTDLSSFDLVIAESHLSGKPTVPSFLEKDSRVPIVLIGEKIDLKPEVFHIPILDFLTKPVREEALSNTFKKINRLSFSLTKLQEFPTYRKRFLAKIGNRLSLIPVENIACFYAENGITFLMESGSGHKFMVDHTLVDLENQLLDPEKFYRINRSIIVNLDNLVEMKPFQNGRLALSLKAKTEESLIVARDKVNSFKAWVDR